MVLQGSQTAPVPQLMAEKKGREKPVRPRRWCCSRGRGRLSAPTWRMEIGNPGMHRSLPAVARSNERCTLGRVVPGDAAPPPAAAASLHVVVSQLQPGDGDSSTVTPQWDARPGQGGHKQRCTERGGGLLASEQFAKCHLHQLNVPVLG